MQQSSAILSNPTVKPAEGLAFQRQAGVPFLCWRIWLAALLAPLCIGACTTPTRIQGQKAESEAAQFYWPYAALATSIYQPASDLAAQRLRLLASPLLRDEVAGNSLARDRLAQLREGTLQRLIGQRITKACNQTDDAAGQNGEVAADVVVDRCLTPKDQKLEAMLYEEKRRNEPNASTDAEPRGPNDCEIKGSGPSVPFEKALKSDEAGLGWERAPEINVSTSVRNWSLFVPDLAIGVWRRKLPLNEGHLSIEYAVVYRGTVGGGGWMSNLRALTAFTPMIWDQYRQAEEATKAIVSQIYTLHAISDVLTGREVPTRIYITTVGHSLGAGLASYIYMRVPQITRVVGFDPSPVDGTSLFGIDDGPGVETKWRTSQDERAQPSGNPSGAKRGDVMAASRHVDLANAWDPQAQIFLLFEKGEIISRLAQCHDGPVWGAEGGPVVRCDSVNFSSGSWLRQHNMAQMARKLRLAHRGLSTGN